METQQQIDLLVRAERKVIEEIDAYCDAHRKLMLDMNVESTLADAHMAKLLMDIIDALHTRLKLIREDIDRLL